MPLGIITAKTPIPYGTTIALMARIRGANGSLITQATVTSITYLLWNITDDTRVMPSTGTRTLTVSSVITDSVTQNDPAWTVDGPSIAGTTIGGDATWGHNFRYYVPATDTAAAEAGDTVRAVVTFTFSDASVLAQLFQWDVLDTNA